MLKHRQNGLAALHGTFLLVLVTAAFIGSIGLAHASGLIHLNSEVNWGRYLTGVIVAMIWIHYSLRGVGDRLGALNWREALRLSAQQLVRLTVVLLTIAFATKDTGVSRVFLASFLAMSGALLFAANLVLARVLAVAFFRRQRLRTVIVARPDEARLLHAWLASRGHLGIDAIGYVTPENDSAGSGDDLLRLGGLAELSAIVARHRVGQLVFSRAAFSTEGAADIVRKAEEAHCRVRFFVDLHAVFGGNPDLLEHNGHYTFAASTPEPLDNPCNRILKRVLDVAVALPAVVLVMPPLTLVVWLMQRRQSPGRIFHGQMRSGLNREHFRIYKFRTMHTGDGSQEARQAGAGDARIYPFGRFLRRTSLDEVPQFLNVIMGSMSVSGPRPHLLEHDEQFARIEHSYYKRHFVKPGITGLAQSKGYRGELLIAADLANRVQYDAFYVAKWSLGLDVGILFSTARQIVAPPKTAY
ncbi:MAG: exopolysaccharide biosynthesis polyprenyl glycosylphosphotransferase [Opitutaceae bacterium]|nr:exopolysaccharide biosynthesis polyprenyl glycosylphosphotransferase [Opitutaceae bacterium]